METGSMVLDRDTILAEIKTYLMDEFSMDSEGVIDMTALFLESLTDAAGKAEEALALGDFAGLAAVGHSIKGSAANIGANAVSAIGAALDAAAKAENAALCAEKVAELAAARDSLNASA